VKCQILFHPGNNGSIESVENIEEFVYKEEIACTTTSSLRKE
jgi:hypothetical protein